MCNCKYFKSIIRTAPFQPEQEEYPYPDPIHDMDEDEPITTRINSPAATTNNICPNPAKLDLSAPNKQWSAPGCLFWYKRAQTGNSGISARFPKKSGFSARFGKFGKFPRKFENNAQKTQNYRRTTDELPTNYRRTTDELPTTTDDYRRLPTNYRRTTDDCRRNSENPASPDFAEIGSFVEKNAKTLRNCQEQREKTGNGANRSESEGHGPEFPQW